MYTTVLLLAKISLLLLLWIFIWLSIRSLRKDMFNVAGVTNHQHIHGVAAPMSPVVAPAPLPQESRHGRATPTSLVVTNGPIAGTTLELAGYKEILLGRGVSCTLVLDDDFASGTHARLFAHKSRWYLEDMDSRNGTYVNEQRVEEATRVYADTEFRVGETVVRML